MKVSFAQVLKANPFHDERGRFTTNEKAKFVSVGGVFDAQRERAKSRDPDKRWLDGLTDAEKQAVSSYWQGTDRHREFNQFVRTYAGTVFGSKGKKMEAAMKEMDSMISKATLPEDKTLYRATQLPGVKTLKDVESLIGGTIKDQGFMATTDSLDYAKRFSQVKGGKAFILSISAKKGSKVANLDKLNPNMKEGEHLFPRGTELKVKSFDKKNGIIHVEVNNG